MTQVKLLFDEWKIQRPDYINFCEDGILVQSKWKNSNPKILFLLKETYSHFIDISGPMGPYGTSKTFWRKMKIWTYIITELMNNREPIFEKIYEIKELPNDSIAYVNIKKNAEKTENNGEANSDYSDILSYAKKDKDFLKRQIDLINPDIILCCATIDFAKELYPDLSSISNKLFQADRKLIISYSHPSNRNSYTQEFADLTTILKGCKIKGIIPEVV